MQANAVGARYPTFPMKGKGAIYKDIKTQSGNPQRAALQQSARDGLPPAPPGGKINFMA
ncbi:MAG: hypothetical protein HY804_07495 [Nitrospinae bacterium]|nr:hypothetical protein [Nitrospinota bacterium]